MGSDIDIGTAEHPALFLAANWIWRYVQPRLKFVTYSTRLQELSSFSGRRTDIPRTAKQRTE